MKTSIHLIQIYCCLAFSLALSCKNKTDYIKEISRLDSVTVKLKNAGTLLLSADSNSIRSTYKFSKEKLSNIAGAISKDTVKKAMAIFLCDVYEQLGNLQHLLENKTYLEHALSETQQRINNLQHDLKERLIEKNKVEEYITNEVKASEKIIDIVNITMQKAKKSSLYLDSLKTQITFIADSIRNNNR